MPDDQSKSSSDQNDQQSEETSQEETPEQRFERVLAAERLVSKQRERDLIAAQKRLTALENKDKPDAEKTAAEIKAAQTERDEALGKLQTANGRSAVIAAAVTAESPKPDVVYKLVKGDLEFDDDGEATNVAELIAQAKKDAPELFRKQTGKGGGGNRDESKPKGKGQMNSIIRGKAGVSTDDE